MRLLLVRHGDAHAGLAGTIAGPKGCRGLTDLGRRQAARLRDHLATTAHLRADVVLASELPRAIETARIVEPALDGPDFTLDCDLCEVHVGEADGLDWADYVDTYGHLDMRAEPDRRFAPGGDSWNSFTDRVDGLMRRIATDHVGKTVVAFCHAGVIEATLRVRIGYHPGDDSAQIRPTNTGITEWEHDHDVDVWTLRGFNDTSHLVDKNV